MSEFKDEFYKKYVSTHIENRKGASCLAEFRLKSEMFNRHFRRFLPDDKNSKIVDLGCGNGRNFDLINTTFLIGIDNSLDFLKIAKKRNLNENRKIELILSDMRTLPLRVDSIDTFLSIASLHHVKGFHSRLGLVNQLYEILKDAGFVLITVWRKYQRKYGRKGSERNRQGHIAFGVIGHQV